jgi:hypothetical protein
MQHKGTTLGTQSDLSARQQEQEKGKDLPREGGIDGVNVIAGGGIVEDDLPAVVIHVDAHFPWIEEQILPGVSLSEGLTREARECAVPRSLIRIPMQIAPPGDELRGHAHHTGHALRKGQVNPARSRKG